MEGFKKIIFGVVWFAGLIVSFPVIARILSFMNFPTWFTVSMAACLAAICGITLNIIVSIPFPQLNSSEGKDNPEQERYSGLQLIQALWLMAVARCLIAMAVYLVSVWFRLDVAAQQLVTGIGALVLFNPVSSAFISLKKAIKKA